MMNREQILAAKDMQVRELSVPGWGKVFIRTMTAAEYEALFDGERIPARAEFAVRVLSDADGNRIFGDDETDLLSGKSEQALRVVVGAAMELNALTNESKRELEKN